MDRKYSVLILTNTLYPNLNANSEIAYRIGCALRDFHGCDITVLGYHKTAEAIPESDPYSLRTVSMKSATEFQRIFLSTPNRFARLAKLLLHPQSMRLYLDVRSARPYSYSRSYLNAVKAQLKRKHYDCIIGVSEPPSILVALSQLKSKVPFISYRLDPWATNILYADDKGIREEEIRSDDAAAAVIVTDLIRRDCAAYSPRRILDKMVAIEFPGIIRQKKAGKSVSFEPGKIHCVYAGVLYKDIRNPAYTLELFKALGGDGVVLHLYGALSSDDVLPAVLPENVVYHGVVDSETAAACMQAADVLVSIGNTISNQMPSKILTYLSMGKPILNLVKIRDCPTLPYLEKYPLGLSLFETPEPLADDVEKARAFILGHSGDSIPFEEIERMYETCTPGYVSDRVYQVICKAVEEAEKQP